MKNKNKGITLVSLVVTIVIILILSTIIIRNTYTGSDYKRYKLMCADVELLEDKILIYYNKYGNLPIITENGQVMPESMSEGLTSLLDTENHEYWKIDATKLSGITLNFGDTEDVFIIDTTTFEVYYLNGVEYDAKIYYTD